MRRTTHAKHFFQAGSCRAEGYSGDWNRRACIFAVCFIARRYEAEETKRLFREHRDAFSSALEIEGREISPFNATLQKAVPDELKELGIGEIYEVNGSVFFEWNQRVLRMFPKGILYTEDEQRIPHWYHIEKIENAWYYYLYN